MHGGRARIAQVSADARATHAHTTCCMLRERVHTCDRNARRPEYAAADVLYTWGGTVPMAAALYCAMASGV